MQKYVNEITIEALLTNLRVTEFGTNRDNGGTKIIFQTLEGYSLVLTESVDCSSGGSIRIKNGDTNLDKTLFTFNDEAGLQQCINTALEVLGYSEVTFDFSDLFLNRLLRSLLYLGLAKEQVICNNTSSISVQETVLLLTSFGGKPESFIVINEIKPEFHAGGISYTMTLTYGFGDDRKVIEDASFGRLNNLLTSLMLDMQEGKTC